MTREEWITGPTQHPHINPFCYIEDVIPSRFAMGFDEENMEFQFMALDPERVGLANVEVPAICDFGDNVLEYMSSSKQKSPVNNINNNDDNDDDNDDDNNEYNFDDDDNNSDNDCCNDDEELSDDNAANDDIDNAANDDKFDHVLPAKMVAFLRS
jgi:hypothetical protein